MRVLPTLFENNQRWSDQRTQADPEFFSRLEAQQKPAYLWIGCSDSRVPANEITGLQSGELFVHRNVANLVLKDDLNSQSVIQYAVDVLQVQHIIICGHYGCGGVEAAIQDQPLGLIDNWLCNIKEIYQNNERELSKLPTHQERVNRLCELNIAQQVANLTRTSIVQKAWERKQPLSIHGWIYGLHDGLLKDLGLCITETNHPNT
jgi:carbonic anhydrase